MARLHASGLRFRPRGYSQSISVTALVSLHGVNRTSGVLAALVGTEVRGVQATPLAPPFGPLAGTVLYHIMVHADMDGERVSFALHDGKNTTALDQTIAFEHGGTVGGAFTPLVLTAGMGGRGPEHQPLGPHQPSVASR